MKDSRLACGVHTRLVTSQVQAKHMSSYVIAPRCLAMGCFLRRHDHVSRETEDLAIPRFKNKQNNFDASGLVVTRLHQYPAR